MITDDNIYVDRDKCYACGLCVERCIMDNLRLSLAPCRQACPIHMNCQGYIRLLAQGREREAVREFQPFAPFAPILGRVCPHLCEKACERSRVDGPVHIRALKKYLADSQADLCFQTPEPVPETGRRAAVIGSGPAGLMAAYTIRTRGHRVVVYEADPEPGGLLRYAIPAFRLPVDHVTALTDHLAALGIEFRTGVKIGENIEFEKLSAEYDATVVALGASTGVAPPFPGCARKAVFQAIDFLRQVKEGRPPAVGRSVLVIGGGNTAVNAALTCRRLGAQEIRVVCLESPSEMPAFSREIEEAREEGILFENGWGPTAIIDPDDGVEVLLSRCIGLYDEQGRFRPELEPACGLKIRTGTVVLALGQKTNMAGFPSSLYDQSSGRPVAAPDTLQARGRDNVFFCGDVLTGPSSVVDALASGHEAGISVDRFLNGEGLKWGRGFWSGPYAAEYSAPVDKAGGGVRCELDKVPPNRRGLNREVERRLSDDKARREAERCLSCGRAFEMNKTCWYCLPCEIECPVNALEVRMPYQVR